MTPTPRDVEPNFREPREKRDNRKYKALTREAEARAGGWCEARIEGVCLGRGDAAHHVKPRSALGKDELTNLLWVCNSGCHAHIHRYPEWAREVGLLKGRYAS